MKKRLTIFVFVFLTIVLIKYYFSNYDIVYNVDNHKVEVSYKNSRFYIEIDDKYNMDIYKNRSFDKRIIKKIKNIKDENLNCVYPIIDNYDSYPLCIVDGELIDFNMLDNELLIKYKKYQTINENNDNFQYFNSLNKNEYIALWNYKGFIVMNNDSYKFYDLFENDKYNNSLSYIVDNYIYMPDYDQEYEFSNLIKFNIENGKSEVINLKYNIDYDSYVVGSIKNNIYIFDNKHAVLYEFNIKKNEMNIKGSNDIGYVKYNNDEFIPCSKSEYKLDKISYDKVKSMYSYKYKNNKLYKVIKDNKKIESVINFNDVSIVGEYKNILYYVYEDNLYKYSSSIGNKKVFYSFELNFNKDNTIFIYNK